MKSPHCFVSLLLCASLLLSAFSGTALATESASVFEFEYAFEDYWYDDEIPAALVGDFPVRSALLMEAESGRILFQKDENKPVPIASVTKVMVTLLIMEAIDSGRVSMDEEVTVSERAASMGGSQVYLEPGEEMKCEDLLKSVIIASANDAAVTLAERVSGSVQAFVVRMNERAKELGMESSSFENPTGLDDNVTNHVTSAYDIALMSRELLKHKKILEYTSIWMDTIRDGAFGLTNTNRLIRFYSGATGLKTGSTSKAKFCISATAERDGMHLIAVIMGAPTRDVRNEAAKTLLDWGFANYFVYNDGGADAGNVRVTGGVNETCACRYGEFSALLESSKRGRITVETELPEELAAPIAEGDCVGRVIYKCGDETVGEGGIFAAEGVAKISYGGILMRIIRSFLLI